ncbi:MAG: HEAT repeat domain-containing protein [Dehalococcoidia bacterium]
MEAGLRRTLEDGGEVEEVRGRALESISSHDGAWVRQAISEAYESDVRGLKVSAVHAMGRSCESRWLPLVLRELSNEDAEIRYEAALACGSLAEEQAVSGLAPLLEDGDGEVQAAAITALGEIGGGAAKELLQGLADNPSQGVREAASEALRESGFGEDPLSIGGGG